VNDERRHSLSPSEMTAGDEGIAAIDRRPGEVDFRLPGGHRERSIFELVYFSFSMRVNPGRSPKEMILAIGSAQKNARYRFLRKAKASTFRA
jgi:hypothetical protein